MSRGVRTDELAVVAACAAESTRPALAGAALSALIELVDAQSGSYVEVPLVATASVGLTVVRPRLTHHADLLRVWADRHREHPWIRYASAGPPGAVRLSDSVPSRQLRALPFYEDLLRSRGGQYGLYFPLSRRRHVLTGLGVVRADRDFSDDDVELLERVRVPLAGIWGQVRARELLTAQLAAVSRGETSTRRPDLLHELTPAEREVALMVVSGMDNASIARARRCSCKAIEHLLTTTYRKLAVASRTQLVAQIAAR